MFWQATCSNRFTCCLSFSIKLTQSKGRFAQLELVTVMAAVVGAVGRGRRRLPHQQIVIDPFGRRGGGGKLILMQDQCKRPRRNKSGRRSYF